MPAVVRRGTSTNFAKSLEPLEPRRLFTGVTLITHGFGGSASDWVAAMGNAIAAQGGPLASQPRYLMTATDGGSSSNPITVTSTRLGPPPANWGSSEIIVLLDWSAMAGSFPFGGHHRPTGEVGFAVADKLLANFSIPDLPTPLAQLPIHLIGHSRGASLISELAKDLGQHGVWVDHETFLDPHPVDGVNDPLGFNFGDAPMRVYDNVQYADDYWRTDGNGTSFDFTGEPVNGAYNLQLSEAILSNGGGSIEHSDVHLWYHGTIGPPYSDTDGSITIGPNWYDPPQGPRDSTGFRYTMIGKGTRPAAGVKSAGAPRVATTLAVSGVNVWDDVQITNLLSDGTLSEGGTILVKTTFEDRSAGGTRDATLTLGLDRDDNPYNGAFSAGSIATSALSSDALDVNLSTTGLSGRFRVYAKISNGTNTRYYYAPGVATINAAGADKTWVGPASGGLWSDANNWSPAGVPATTQTAAIHASDVTLTADTMIAGLTLSGGASLNVGDRDLIVNYGGSSSPIETLRSAIVSGRSASAAGIYSPAAKSSGGVTTLGYGEASDVRMLSGSQTALFDGFTIDATTVIVKYTYTGDADLSGRVDGDDYFRLDSHLLSASPVAPGWSWGDFDFNRKLDGDDYFLIDSNLARQGVVL
jgi:hypothetical protein